MWILIICYTYCTWGMPDISYHFKDKKECQEQAAILHEQGAKISYCVPAQQDGK